MMLTKARIRIALIFTGCLGAPMMSAAQAVIDTTKAYELESVVVTADRGAGQVAGSVGSVSVVSPAELPGLPITNLPDALQLVPGFSFLNLDGMGNDPQVTVRGFYGGGQAEYVVVLVDGKRINRMEQGLLNWNALPLEGVQSIEVLRGGASSLYGDAAIGGVINLVTGGSSISGTRVGLKGGSFGRLGFDLSHTGAVSGRAMTAYASGSTLGGYRDHSARREAAFGGSYDLINREGTKLSVSTNMSWRSFEEPGPLTPAQIASNREGASSLFQFDETDEAEGRVSLDGRFELSEMWSLDTGLSASLRTADQTKSLQLAAEFADTKDRLIETRQAFATAQLTGGFLAGKDRLVVGVDVESGALGTEYFNVATAPDAATPGERLDLDVARDASRLAAAVFAQYDLRPHEAVRLTAGARYDVVNDSFDPAGDADDPRHSAFSPKAGVNLRYMNSETATGNLYVNASRSFKTATLDQMFDPRRIPIPFEPWSISLSNESLEPQTGTSVEAGLYQRLDLVPGELSGELSLSVYQMNMTNEIDFSFEQFSYVNIGKSRHEGIESGLKLFHRSGALAYANYTMQDVTVRFGDNDGRRVKAIPLHSLSAGLTLKPVDFISTGVAFNLASDIYLDDANSVKLDDYSTVDLRVGWTLGKAYLSADVMNVLGSTYSTTGYTDPGGSDVLFLYPSVGRHFLVSLSYSLAG